MFIICSYCPKYLVQENVIVVTLNYRLGALGFLCLPEAGISGNAGLKDQVTYSHVKLKQIIGIRFSRR